MRKIMLYKNSVPNNSFKKYSCFEDVVIIDNYHAPTIFDLKDISVFLLILIQQQIRRWYSINFPLNNSPPPVDFVNRGNTVGVRLHASLAKQAIL